MIDSKFHGDKLGKSHEARKINSHLPREGQSPAASLVDFWIGTGFLETMGDQEYHETIFSKSQIEKLGDKITYLDNSDEELKEISKYFKRIPVFRRNA